MSGRDIEKISDNDNTKQSQQGQATIFDVAKACGVSYATVSRVLNGHSDVRQSTREAVLEACRMMNYRPSAIAKGLTQKKSWLIGVLYQGNFDHPFFGKLLSSLKATVETAGYELIFFHGWSNDKIQELVDRVKFRGIDGLVVAGVSQDRSVASRLQSLGLPLVTINFRLSESSSAVISGHYRGGVDAMQHLWDLGHRDIGFISGEQHLSSGLYRLKAYEHFLAEKGREMNPLHVIASDFSDQADKHCHREVSKWISRGTLPTALFCSYDIMAYGALTAFQAAGIRVPQDVSIIGFDDLELCTYVKPALTTVRQDRDEMGRLAGGELLRLIGDESARPRTISVPTTLVVRNSTDVPHSNTNASFSR